MLGEPLTYNESSNGYEPSMFGRGRMLDRVDEGAYRRDSVDQILGCDRSRTILDSRGHRANAGARCGDVRRTVERILPSIRKELLNGALFDVEYDQMVVVKIDRVLQSLRTPSAPVLRGGARRVSAR